MGDAELLLLAESKKKSGIIAALLNLFLPGAGYFYCARPVLGIIAFIFAVVVGVVSLGMLYAVVALIVFIDGFLCANRYNKRMIENLLMARNAAVATVPPAIKPTTPSEPVNPPQDNLGPEGFNATPLVILVSVLAVAAVIYSAIEKHRELAAPALSSEAPTATDSEPQLPTADTVQQLPPATISSAPPDPGIQMPAAEKAFVEAVATAQAQSIGAKNDMQRGGIKATRDQFLCAILSRTQGMISNWIGTVSAVDSNGDGKGVLGIQLANDLIVTTYNNSLSDIEHGTLIEPGSDVFKNASAMSVGEPVMFSGNFFRDDNTCIVETSVTLRGNVDSPEFLFRFSAVSVPHTTHTAETKTTVAAPTPEPPIGPSPTEAVSEPIPAPPTAIRHAIPTKIATVATTEEAAPLRPVIDDLTPIRSVDATAADHIVAYCTAAAAKADSRREAIEANCRHSESVAWRRLTVEHEFPDATPTVIQKCSQAPFPDSYVAKEECAKYELHR